MDDAIVLTTITSPFPHVTENTFRNIPLARARSYAQPDRILVERDHGPHQVSPTRNRERPAHLLKEVGQGIWKPTLEAPLQPSGVGMRSAFPCTEPPSA